MSKINFKFKVKLEHTKKRAKQRNLSFDLTKEWLQSKLNKNICEATGLQLNHNKDPFINPYYPVIDRIDSTKGYTQDNCQIVCWMFNNAKADHPVEVFEIWANEFVKKYEEEKKNDDLL